MSSYCDGQLDAVYSDIKLPSYRYFILRMHKSNIFKSYKITMNSMLNNLILEKRSHANIRDTIEAFEGFMVVECVS